MIRVHKEEVVEDYTNKEVFIFSQGKKKVEEFIENDPLKTIYICNRHAYIHINLTAIRLSFGAKDRKKYSFGF